MYSFKTRFTGINISKKATCVEYQAILIISPWSKWSLFFSIAFPIWKPYFSLTIQKQSCFWPGRTAQNHLKVCTFSFLDVLITMVVVSSLSDQQFVKVCISLYNGNFAKKNPWFGVSLIPPFTLPFGLPRWCLIRIQTKQKASLTFT